MNPILRRVIASLAVTGGFILLYFEIARFNNDFESWFWIAVSAMASLLGLIELSSKAPKR